MNKLWKLFIVANLLNIIDVFQTLFVVRVLGGIEINPAMAWLLNQSHTYFVIFKVCFVLLLSTFLVKYKQVRSLKVFIWMFGIVVTWNLLNIIAGLWWIY